MSLPFIAPHRIAGTVRGAYLPEGEVEQPDDATERRERLATWFRTHGSLFNALCILTAMLSAGYVGVRVIGGAL